SGVSSMTETRRAIAVVWHVFAINTSCFRYGTLEMHSGERGEIGDQHGVEQQFPPAGNDRVAQMVVKRALEPLVEPHFHDDSYGYRPGKSALDAVGVARQRCWRYDWVLDLDIKSFFHEIDRELLMRPVRNHTNCPWVVLYLDRWLRAPVQMADGCLISRERGTPQGGVVTPRTQKVTSALIA